MNSGFTPSFVRGGRLLFVGSFAGMLASTALVVVGAEMNRRLGVSYQPSYVVVSSGIVLIVSSLFMMGAVGSVGSRRYGRWAALTEMEDAKQNPRTPKQIAHLARFRASTELRKYKWYWWQVVGTALFLSLFIGPLLILLFVYYAPSAPDAPLLRDVVVPQCAYLLGTVAVFLRYPSTTRMSEDISSWLSDTTAILPMFTQYGTQPWYTGPRSILKPLMGGLLAISVTVFLAVILLMISAFSSTLAPLIPYEEVLALLGFVGMILHRWRATGVVKKALAEHDARMRLRTTFRGSQREPPSSNVG